MPPRTTGHRTATQNANGLPYPNRSQPTPASLSTSEITLPAQMSGATTPNSIHSTSVLASHISSIVGEVSPYPWWRISDDKVTECSTRDVLKEESGAYLLFYERMVH
jgi:hypothetical protein